MVFHTSIFVRKSTPLQAGENMDSRIYVSVNSDVGLYLK
jgi:hypothetical protein